MLKKPSNKNQNAQACLVVVTTMLAIGASCGKSDSTATTGATTLTMSGSMTASGTSAARLSGVNSSRQSSVDSEFRSLIGEGPMASAAVDLSTHTLHCATSDIPPVEATGKIKSDGTFSIEIAGGVGKALNCNVLDSTGEAIASMLLSDSSNKDMNGNAQVNGSPAVSAAVTKLGAVNLDLTTGDVVVPASQVVDGNGVSALVKGASIAAAGTPFDPTGLWQIKAVDFTLPKGVKSVCPATHDENNDCNGPPADAKLYLNRLKGVAVSDGSAVFGMQVWHDEAQVQDPKGQMDSCGAMTGLSAADAAKAGVDLSAYGAKNGAFAFATSITDPKTNSAATVANGYQLSTATANYSMKACFPKAITSGGTTYNAFVCGPDTAGNGSPGGRYNAGLGGGCVDSAGKSLSKMDWSKVNWNGSCTMSAGSVTGFYKSVCTATYDSTSTITCTNEFGVFSDAALATAVNGSNGNPAAFNYSGLSDVMTAGANCSTVTDDLMKVRCYADYYQQNVRGSTGCLPRVDMDWSATTAADFAKPNFRPNSLVFMEKLNYSDANTASMLTQQTQHWGVKVQNSSGQDQWVNCGVVEKGGLFFTKQSDTKILATYISATSTTSTDQPACVGASWNGQKDKFFFYLVKQ